jgi:hypothetical protein
MRLTALKRIALVLVSASAVMSCQEDATTAPPITGAFPIGTGYWYMNTVNDSAMGSVISTRIAGVAQEKTYLDSAWLLVGVDGTYEQRYWTRVFLTGLLDRKETVIDYGTWALAGDTYEFTSNVRERVFLIAPTINGRLRSLEPMVFYTDPPESEGEYRRTRP